MPCLSVSDLNAVSGLERECIDHMSASIEDALADAKNFAHAKGLDHQLVSHATVPLLLITAASMAMISCPSSDRELLALSFMRCAAEAMASVLRPDDQGWRH